MDDAIRRFCAASEPAAMDDLMEALAPGVEVVSPLSGRMVFRGHDDVRHLFAAVYTSLADCAGPIRWGRVTSASSSERRASSASA
jgi:hypothetical protein